MSLEGADAKLLKVQTSVVQASDMARLLTHIIKDLHTILQHLGDYQSFREVDRLAGRPATGSIQRLSHLTRPMVACLGAQLLSSRRTGISPCSSRHTAKRHCSKDLVAQNMQQQYITLASRQKRLRTASASSKWANAGSAVLCTDNKGSKCCCSSCTRCKQKGHEGLFRK